MDFQYRKVNRAKPYDYSTSGAYFVTICTNGRAKILGEIVGDGFPVPKPAGRIAEELIRRIPEKYADVWVDQYVIMPDHIHILLQIGQQKGTGNPSPTLGNVIGWYKYQATKEINEYSGCQGQRVFQRSYYDHVIRNQQDYDEVWQYIENNPRKWLIQKQSLE